MPSLRIRVGLVVMLFALSAVVAARTSRFEDVPLRSPFAEFPAQIGDRSGIAQAPFPAAVLDILRVDDYLTRVYVAPAEPPVALYIGYWRSQRQGDTIHSPLNCLPGAGWETLSRRTLTISTAPDDAPVAVNRLVIQKGLERDLVLYWYQSHGRVVASEYTSRLWLVADAMRLNRTDGAIVRVIAPMANDTPGAEATAEQAAVNFVQAMFPSLSHFLPA